MNIGFIGLGRMGGGICSNLIRNGYKVLVFDSDPPKMEGYKDKASISKDAVEILRGSDLIFLSLPSSVQVEEITAQFICSGVKGKTVIDLSTSFPPSSREIYMKFKNEGGFFADASLTGTPAQAAEGKAAVLFGGDRNVYDRYKPVIGCFAREVYYMGESGAGNVTKLANNYLACMYTALYSEIFTLAEKMGMDPKRLFDVISDSGVNCPIYQLSAGKITKRDYFQSFALELALKDMTYIKKMSEKLQVPSLMLDGGLNMMRMAVSEGLGQKDITEMARIPRKLCGLE